VPPRASSPSRVISLRCLTCGRQNPSQSPSAMFLALYLSPNLCSSTTYWAHSRAQSISMRTSGPEVMKHIHELMRDRLLFQTRHHICMLSVFLVLSPLSLPLSPSPTFSPPLFILVSASASVCRHHRKAQVQQAPLSSRNRQRPATNIRTGPAPLLWKSCPLHFHSSLRHPAPAHERAPESICVPASKQMERKRK